MRQFRRGNCTIIKQYIAQLEPMIPRRRSLSRALLSESPLRQGPSNDRRNDTNVVSKAEAT